VISASFLYSALAVRVQQEQHPYFAIPSVLLRVRVDPRRFFMSATIFNTTCNTTPIVAIWAGESNELVWGHDQWLLQRVMPLVSQQSLVLDLRSIERIDAAGIAALVTLYATACQAGHSFTVSNPLPQVARILALVGLDRIFLSQNAVQTSYCGPQLQRSAA
jgi:anti-anti-sigma factor